MCLRRADPFIVMCAPNGARRSQADHGRLPVTPAELADCAESIHAAGASIMHVHVRDDDGAHSLDVDRYRDAIVAIRERIDDSLVIQVTTEACGIYTPECQMSVVRELRPESVSVALRELCPDSESERRAAEFYRWMSDNHVMPQHILYSAEDVARFEALRGKGVIPEDKPFVLFVLGRYAENLTGDVSALESFVDAVSDDVVWAVCCFGSTEHDAVLAAMRQGGHARVGFANTIEMHASCLAADNADLVGLAAVAAEDEDRVLATADDVRHLFG